MIKLKNLLRENPEFNSRISESDNYYNMIAIDYAKLIREKGQVSPEDFTRIKLNAKNRTGYILN